MKTGSIYVFLEWSKSGFTKKVGPIENKKGKGVFFDFNNYNEDSVEGRSVMALLKL